MRPRPGPSRFGGTLGAFCAAAAVVLAALLPGLHGLSLNGHECGAGACTHTACAPEARQPAVPAPVAARSRCACGHDHDAEAEARAPLAAAASEAERASAAPAGEPRPAPPEPHDHHNCPVCKVIFTGAHRFAADIAPPAMLIAAAKADAFVASHAEPPRVSRSRDAQPRAPPAVGRVLRA
jgi:hypothetical protein